MRAFTRDNFNNLHVAVSGPCCAIDPWRGCTRASGRSVDDWVGERVCGRAEVHGLFSRHGRTGTVVIKSAVAGGGVHGRGRSPLSARG